MTMDLRFTKLDYERPQFDWKGCTSLGLSTWPTFGISKANFIQLRRLCCCLLGYDESLPSLD